MQVTSGRHSGAADARDVLSNGDLLADLHQNSAVHDMAVCRFVARIPAVADADVVAVPPVWSGEYNGSGMSRVDR